jgi:hypothetical protein
LGLLPYFSNFNFLPTPHETEYPQISPAFYKPCGTKLQEQKGSGLEKPQTYSLEALGNPSLQIANKLVFHHTCGNFKVSFSNPYIKIRITLHFLQYFQGFFSYFPKKIT